MWGQIALAAGQALGGLMGGGGAPAQKDWSQYQTESPEAQVSQMNVLRDAARESGLDPEAVANDPQGFFKQLLIGNQTPKMQAGNGTEIDGSAYQPTAGQQTETALGEAETADQQAPQQAQTYEAAKSLGRDIADRAGHRSAG